MKTKARLVLLTAGMFLLPAFTVNAGMFLLPAFTVNAADQDRDQDRDQTRQQLQDQTRDQLKDKEMIYGYDLMTVEERAQHRAKMQSLNTEEEREAYREEHHKLMQARARERGVDIPEVPRRKIMGPQSGMRSGGGSGGGAGGGGGSKK